MDILITTEDSYSIQLIDQFIDVDSNLKFVARKGVK